MAFTMASPFLSGNTMLHYCAIRNDFRMLRRLQQMERNVNGGGQDHLHLDGKNLKGSSALMEALVRFLIGCLGVYFIY